MRLGNPSQFVVMVVLAQNAVRIVSPALLVVVLILCVADGVAAHGSPERWAAESTDFGCWLTRWLEGEADANGQAIVGMQVVLGQIIPARGGSPRTGITAGELAGELTLNVRVTDPSLKDAVAIDIGRTTGKSIGLGKRELSGELGEFPSFYVSGAKAEGLARSLRAGQVSAVIVRRSGGEETRFPIPDAGLRVGLAMYDACVASKEHRPV